MVKKSNPITKKSSRTKIESPHTIFSWRQKPVSDEFLKQLINDGIEWAANDPEAYKIKPFFKKRRITTNDIKRWQERSDEFAEGYQFMKEIIGDRREIGALKKQLDSAIVLRSMHQYDPEWLEIDQHHAALRKTDEQQPSKIQVEVIQYPSTDRVPEKKDKK